MFELADRLETLDVIPGPRKRNPGSLTAEISERNGRLPAVFGTVSGYESWDLVFDGPRDHMKIFWRVRQIDRRIFAHRR